MAYDPRLGLGRLDADVTTLLRPTNLKLHLTIGKREEGVVPTHAHVGARVKFRAALANRDIPSLGRLAPKSLTPRRFDSESRPLRVLPPAFLCAMA